MMSPEVIEQHIAAMEAAGELRWVPNRLFREAFLAQPATSLQDVARALYGPTSRETSRVARILGMAPTGGRRLKTGNWYAGCYQQRVSYDVAVRLCDALHIDYTLAGV